MVVLPVGTLTFVLTDLVASTRSWETQTRAMRAAMERHDEIVYAAVARHSGVMVESGRAGDSIFAVFRAAKDAASCAIEVQRAFRTAQWPERLSLRIRIALHTGEVELRGGHYFGPALNRCARVLALCHGGQSLTTQVTRELLVEDPPADVELTDLGLHRLKDLRRLERVYQLTDLSSSDRFPPLHSRPEYRTNLPILLTSFVGRERELAELRTLLHASRLLTLTGTGGAGKTRLAKRLANEVAGEMPAGVWFVELAPVSDPRLVARTVASALDVEEQQGRPLIETLVDHCTGTPMLLVLDNCEHL
ncbi:MAG: adenylate/guanylate cyclase domain-containing protein, partial [Chloroflexota bacterium]|nr:adenylate/guanylate cyclase domain-containing protein [Chloroflexota bacterium]